MAGQRPMGCGTIRACGRRWKGAAIAFSPRGTWLLLFRSRAATTPTRRISTWRRLSTYLRTRAGIRSRTSTWSCASGGVSCSWNTTASAPRGALRGLAQGCAWKTGAFSWLVSEWFVGPVLTSRALLCPSLSFTLSVFLVSVARIISLLSQGCRREGAVVPRQARGRPDRAVAQ